MSDWRGIRPEEVDSPVRQPDKRSGLLGDRDKIGRMERVRRVGIIPAQHQHVAVDGHRVLRHADRRPLVSGIDLDVPGLVLVGEHVYLRPLVPLLRDRAPQKLDRLARRSRAQSEQPRHRLLREARPDVRVDLQHLRVYVRRRSAGDCDPLLVYARAVHAASPVNRHSRGRYAVPCRRRKIPCDAGDKGPILTPGGVLDARLHIYPVACRPWRRIDRPGDDRHSVRRSLLAGIQSGAGPGQARQQDKRRRNEGRAGPCDASPSFRCYRGQPHPNSFFFFVHSDTSSTRTPSTGRPS